MSRDDTPVVPQWTDPGGVLAEPDVADPAKGTWDVYVNDDGRLPARRDPRRPARHARLGPADPAPQRQYGGQLLPLPSWQAAPPQLRDEMHRWLGDDTRDPTTEAWREP